MEVAMSWLRDDFECDDVDHYRKLDTFVRPQRGKWTRDRAKEMENALDWLRGNGVDVDSLGDDYALPFDQAGGGLSIDKRSKNKDLSRDRSGEDRAKEMEGALNWLRNGGNGDSDDVEDFAYA